VQMSSAFFLEPLQMVLKPPNNAMWYYQHRMT
jgi:hypothetical protein